MAGPNSLYPSFVQIHYHSQWAPHSMTLPTRQWNNTSLLGAYGSYSPWTGGTVDADVMINAFVDKLAVVAQAGIAWDYAVIYNYPAPLPATPQPVKVLPLTQVGAVTITPAALAIENVYTMFDTAFNTVKLVCLDMDASFGLIKYNYGDLNSAHKDIVDMLGDGTYAWSSRAGNKPNGLRSVISKPNDKLRREYRIV